MAIQLGSSNFEGTTEQGRNDLITATAAANPGQLVKGDNRETITRGGMAPVVTEQQAFTNPIVNFVPKTSNSGVLTSGPANEFQGNVKSDLTIRQENLTKEAESLSSLLGGNITSAAKATGNDGEYRIGGFAFNVNEDASLKGLVNNPDLTENQARMAVAQSVNRKAVEERNRQNKERLDERQYNEGKTNEVAQFRGGRAGTDYAKDYLADITTEHGRQQIEFQRDQQDILDTMQGNIMRGFANRESDVLGRTAELYKEYNDIEVEKEKAKDDFLKQQKEVLDVQKKLSEEGGDVYAMVQSGFEPTESQLAVIEAEFGLRPGTGALLYSATQSKFNREQKKEELAETSSILNIQKSLEDLADRPMDRQSKILDIQKKLRDSQFQMYDEMNKVFDAMKDAPLGMAFDLGPGAQYFGLGNGSIFEKGADGSGMLGWRDAEGNILTQNLGYMGDPADLETVYVDGRPVMRNKRTGVELPVQGGIMGSQTSSGWDALCPPESVGGQCGEFVHTIVADYPYGLHSTEKKRGVVNVPAGQVPRVGDVLLADVGTDNGHAAVVETVYKGTDGKMKFTLRESNWQGNEKVDNTRSMSVDDSSIMGYFRGTVKPQFRTGSDTRRTEGYNVAPPPPVQRNPFITPGVPMTEAQMTSAGQKWQEAQAGAQNLLDGGSKDDISTEVRTTAMRLAREGGWKPDISDEKTLAQADGLRKEFQGLQEVKEFKTVRDSYAQIKSIGQEDSAAGDLSLIFSYMKLLDPNSVVRETEFANAENAAGIPDRIRNMWNRAKEGERLNEDQRTDFTNKAETIYQSRLKQLNPTINQYKTLAKKRKLDPADVIFDIEYSPPINEGEQQTIDNIIYRWDGSSWQSIGSSR